MAAKPPKKKFVHLADMAPGAARNKRVAALAANPGSRSKIPTALLPAKYQAGRKTAQRIAEENATLYNPAQILSGNDLRKSVRGLVSAQIDPQVAAFSQGIKTITGQRNATLDRAAQIAGGYNAATAASAAGLSSAGQQLAAQVAAQGQKTQDVLTGIQAEDASRRAADVALRGQGLQGPDQAAQALDLAKVNAAGATSSATAQAAAQAAGASNLAGTIAATAPMRANDQQFALASKFNQQIADMTSKRAEAEAQRGPLTAQTLEKERQDQFTNLATMKGLDLKASDLQETIRKNQATESLTKAAITQRNLDSIRDAKTAHEKNVFDQRYKRAQLDIKRGIDPITGKPLPKKPQSQADALNAWKLKFARDHGYLPKTGPPTKGKGNEPGDVPTLTPNESSKQQGKFASIQSQISGATSKKGGPGKYDRHQNARDYLEANPATDPLYVSAALDMIYDGHVSRTNANKLHKRGLTVKDLGLTSYQEFKRKGGLLKPGRRPGPAGSIPFIGATRRG